MRRTALAICGAIIAGTSVVAVYWPAPVVEVSEGVFAQQISEDEWTLSCLGPCAEDTAKLVCTRFEAVGDQEVGVDSRFVLTVTCRREPSGDS
jgi:hypothetical protein